MAEVGNPALVRDGYSTLLDIDGSADTKKELTRCRYSGIKPLVAEWSVFQFKHRDEESREPYDQECPNGSEHGDAEGTLEAAVGRHLACMAHKF
jgi:hypothetical protein